ncbi:MAG: GNAT family N-acetyltransferase [Candidatus Hodarchaeota archaeon]
MPLEGNKIYLREHQRSDIPKFREWRNILETQGWSKTLPPDYTDEMYFKRHDAREFSYNPKQGLFTIVRKSNDEVIGLISYSHLAPRHSAVIGIILDQKYWGQGYGFDAQETLLKFLFIELGLQVVRLWTHGGNPGAVKLAQRSGFRISSRTREGVMKGGKFVDNLSMDLLREEFFELHPELSNNIDVLIKEAP